MIEWALGEMFQLSPVSRVLTRLPRQHPNIWVGCRASTAGAPFELPYTLQLSDIDQHRWRGQRDLIDESAILIKAIRPLPDNLPDGPQVLIDIEKTDEQRMAYIRKRIDSTRYSPRLPFSGKFTTNVNTVNNNDFQQAIDVTRMTVDLQGMTEAELRAWMKEVIDLGGGRRAIRSGWNYFGDNGCRLVDTVITGTKAQVRVAMTTRSSEPRSGSKASWSMWIRTTCSTLKSSPTGSALPDLMASPLWVSRRYSTPGG